MQINEIKFEHKSINKIKRHESNKNEPGMKHVHTQL